MRSNTAAGASGEAGLGEKTTAGIGAMMLGEKGRGGVDV
jgi:hypothetical protein